MADGNCDKAPSLNPWRFSFGLLIALVICFPDVLFGGRAFFFRDYATFGYPLAAYHRQSFWMGEMALWNPLNHFGLPFLAQWNTLVLYPPSLIYLLLPLPYSLDLFCILHLFSAGLGMYFLARRWAKSEMSGAVAGFGFAFSGLAMSCLKWPNNIAALGLLPWVVLVWEISWTRGRKAICAAMILGSLQMLSGAPEIILFTWVFIFALSCGKAWLRRDLGWQIARRGLLCVSVIAALSAAQLLPFFELLSNSQRSAEFDSGGWAMPPWGWLNLFVPLFRSFPSHQGVFAQFDQYWISSYYPGIIILALAIIGAMSRNRKAWLLLGITFASLILSLGSAGVVYDWVNKVIPISSFMRFPIKFVVLAGFCLPLLAAFAVEPVINFGRSSRQQLFVVVALIAVIAGVVVVANAKPVAELPIPAEQQAAIALRSGLSRIGFLIAAIAITFMLRRHLPSRTNILLQCGFLALVFFDGISHSPRLNPTVESWVYGPINPAMDILNFNPRPTIGQARAHVTTEAHERLSHRTFPEAARDVMYSRGALLANCNLLDKIPKTDGFYSLNFPAEQKIQQLLASTNRSAVPGLRAFLSISHRTAPVTSTDKVLEWEPLPSHLPWLTIGQKPIFADAKDTLAGLASPTFDPGATVFLPQLRTDMAEHPSAIVQVRNFAPHSITATVETPGPTVLVMSQAYYPAWKAYVDAQEVSIVRANLAFQAIRVPAGKHEIAFVYDDRAFKIGAVVSILTLAGVSIVFVSGFRRKLPSAAINAVS